MKKTMRTIIALFLAAVMTFGMSSAAFAADDSVKKIEWTNLFGDDYSFYFGNTELIEGENAVTIYDSNVDILNLPEDELRGMNVVCYEFEAEQTGYYLLSSDYDTVFSVAESYNGTKADGCRDCVKYGEEPYYNIFHIKKGTNLIGITFAFESYILMDSVNIEFLGSDIKDYSLSEESLDDYIIGYNVWDDGSGEIAMATDCEVTFVPENKFVMNGVVLMGTCSASPKEGKNKAKVDLFGKKKDVEFTAYYMDSLVKSAEITNIDRHTVFSYDYKGEQHYNDASGEKLTVKFSDGTEYSAVINDSMAEVVLSNGVVAYAYAGLTLNNDGTYDFIISVGDEVVEKYDVVGKENSFFDNISTLSNDNFEALASSADNFIVGIQHLGSDRDFSMQCFGLISDDLAQIFANFIAFVQYYIG